MPGHFYQVQAKNGVLYMSFDKFLLAIESRDLSQADKSIIPVIYTVGQQATFWNMNSSVRAVLVVWPGKAAVDLIGFKIEFKLPHSTHKKPAKSF